MKPLSVGLSTLNPRWLVALVWLLAAGLLLAGWTLALRQPYAQYRQLGSNRAALSVALGQTPDPGRELGPLALELKRLSDKLNGGWSLPVADDVMAASLMKALDRSAAGHGVLLAGIKPKARRQVAVFEEVSFEVSASGSYLQLGAWMLDFDQVMGHKASITAFAMKTLDAGRQVALTLDVALYRPVQPVQQAGP
jgi:Tfp pilus assembly protein PilO